MTVTLRLDGVTRTFENQALADAFVDNRQQAVTANGRRNSPSYSPRTPLVLEHMAGYTHVTAKQIQDALDIPRPTLNRILGYLILQGSIKYAGRTPGPGYCPLYRITEQGLNEVGCRG